MKKILTLITLTVLLFTGQAFAKDDQQALSKIELVTQGEESSSCSIPSGVWHDTSWEKDFLWMSVMRVKANGDYFFESLSLSESYPAELGADKGAYSCKDGYLFDSDLPNTKIKIKHHTVDKLILVYIEKDGYISQPVTYTSEFKEKKQTFELNPEQMNSYKSFVKYLKAPGEQLSCMEKLKNYCQNTLEKYINSDDSRASCNKMIDETPIGVSTSCYIVSKEIKPIFETKGFHFAVRMEMARLGDNANLNHIDTSSVTDMKSLFKWTSFNGDISKWNVSNVTDMSDMFLMAESFKGDISSWNVSNVTDMSNMFKWTSFNGDISDWDVSNVEKMDNIGNDDLKKLIIAQRQEKELKEECKKIKPISTGDICTSVLGLVAVNFKDEIKNKQTPDPQKLTQLFELSEYTFGQFASCSKREPTIEQVKVMTCQLINGDLDHLLLKNLNNKRGAKKVINLSVKQCIDQGMDIANKTRAKYGSNPTAEQALDVSIESGVSLSEMMHCKKLSEEKPWEYAQEAAKRF